jgi:16S rRNA (cytosine967-C5)-methyltransferase
MASPPSRTIISKCLERWENETVHADRILSDLSSQYQLDARDHAFVQQLFYGIIRNLTLLDACIDHLRNHKGLNHRMRILLRIGLFQLRHTHIAPHAAINETVALANNRQSRALVNAILRNAQRKHGELDELVASLPLDLVYSHPEFLIKRWTAQFGEDSAIKLCAWNNQTPPVYLRLNSLANQPAALQAIRDSGLTHPVANVPEEFLRLDGPVPNDWIDQGLVYIQDPSTAIACRLLDPQPGQSILDACAAPGGKSLILASAMANTGTLVACDADGKRLQRLCANLDRSHVRNYQARRMDWSQPGGISGDDPQPASFDAILIDAPCSNTGVMRRRIDVRWRLRPDDFLSLQKRQLTIAGNCLPLLKPGGHLVYSTCSLENEENQALVDILLEEFPSLELEQTQVSLPWRDSIDGAFAARLRLG